MIIVSWILFSFIVAMMGTSRNIGGIAAFFISIIFSPIIGIIVVLCSKSLSDISNERKMYEKTVEQAETLKTIANKSSYADEVIKLKNLLDQQIISNEEFEREKLKLNNK